ncbi:Single-stranded-DNA-specific exonuclease RecJ [compost metagenome]
MEYAKSQGIDVIITDHHEPQEQIPQALAVINPKQSDCPYVTKELSGCGVAFKFLQALAEFTTGDSRKMERYLDIVTIGTVADVMDLVGENRLIVKFGLEQMTDTHNRGIQQLIQVLGLDEKEEITAKHIGWNIAPIINAAGRLGDPAEAVQLFLTDSRRVAHRVANELKLINDERRKLTEEWTKKIVKVVDAMPDLLAHHIMIIPFPAAVPEGLVGLIAGRLKERYSRPVILLAPEAHNPLMYFGSGRSIPAYNMFDEILPLKSMLEKFGGHGAACGMTIKREKIAELSRILNEAAKGMNFDVRPRLFIDYEIEPEHITKSFAEDLKLMEPFGKGNSKPLFLLRDASAGDVKALGKTQTHLKMNAHVQNHVLEAIGFSMVDKWKAIGEPKRVDIAFYPGLNEWQGRVKVQLEMQDIREAQ